MSARKTVRPSACVYATVRADGTIISFYDSQHDAFWWTREVGDSVVRYDRKRVVRVRHRKVQP